MRHVFTYIKTRWKAKAGYSEFLKIALPLIISNMCFALQNFVDRFFLAWYCHDSYAATLPVELLQCSVMFIFLGAVSYVDVFVFQYNGKQEYKSIGPAIWQAVYLSLVSSIILFIPPLFSDGIFRFIGHPQAIVCEEVKYFNILCWGSFANLGILSISGFYAGRSKTKVILLVNLIGIVSNIVLDYFLIFGNFGFPKWGIEGAAIATMSSFFVMFLVYVFLITSKKNNARFNTRNLKPDFKFLKRLARFGFPNGVHIMFIDLSLFTFFALIIGRTGELELSASNIVLNIHNFVYMALVGCSIATSVMVGNYLGKNKASMAKKVVKSATQISLAIIFLAGLLFVLVPNLLIKFFEKGSEALIIE